MSELPEVDWYRDFFRGVVLDVWQSAMTADKTRAECDFLERALELRPGARVLDAPCGLGRHSLELSARGMRMTGVDLSDEAIARARTGPGAARVEWRCADIRELPWTAELDGAFCFGNSFAYLPPEGNRAFVSAVARALSPGARFVLDTGTAAESILPRLREREEMTLGDVLFVEENVYHPFESCLETRYTFVRGGRSETRTGLHWIYTVRELRELLGEAGLAVTGAFRSLAGEPFTVGSPYLILTARKESSARSRERSAAPHAGAGA